MLSEHFPDNFIVNLLVEDIQLGLVGDKFDAFLSRLTLKAGRTEIGQHIQLHVAGQMADLAAALSDQQTGRQSSAVFIVRSDKRNITYPAVDGDQRIIQISIIADLQRMAAENHPVHPVAPHHINVFPLLGGVELRIAQQELEAMLISNRFDGVGQLAEERMRHARDNQPQYIRVLAQQRTGQLIRLIVQLVHDLIYLLPGLLADIPPVI
ncbi:hypothetical protein D3C73_817290 [compost metagenome]